MWAHLHLTWLLLLSPWLLRSLLFLSNGISLILMIGARMLVKDLRISVNECLGPKAVWNPGHMAITTVVEGSD